MTEAYKVRDRLALWWLGNPDQPRLVGEVGLATAAKGVNFRYSHAWLEAGFALSADLPLHDALFRSPTADTAPGALEDARPDRWGERVIRKFIQTPRLSLLELLLFAGGDRYGALAVSTSFEVFEPWQQGPMPTLDSLQEMHKVIGLVLAGVDVPEQQRRLVYPGATLGGARPKSMLVIDGQPWIVKFAEGDDFDMPLVEHACMTLASTAGINVASTKPLKVGSGHAVAIQRFDRLAGQRLHVMSAHVALRAAGLQMSYPELAQMMRRICPAATFAAQQEQLFRRMIFNILMDNTDDHEKNHALLRDLGTGYYSLSPAFDVLPTLQGLGYQGMEVGSQGTESTIENALSRCRDFGLSLKSAKQIVHSVQNVTDNWEKHFMDCGVNQRDMRQLRQYIRDKK